MSSTPVMPAPSRLAICRSAFRNSCAMGLALAIAGNAGSANAQSFLGTPTFDSATVAIDSSVSGVTDISVSSSQAVITWDLPSSTVAGNPAEIFQPAGTTATFHEGGSFTSPTFTVLNRILPFDIVGGAAVNRPVQFNGTVNSTFGGVQGGEIWFFSPSGIIAGPTASFNVGSLVLTTNDIDTTGGLYGTGGEIRFRGAASSLAPVEIQSGAVIDAAASSGAYVAIVAPRIVQAGTVGADGHVALVAAEQADITINTGLLNIVVTQGTTDSNGIVHTGSTGGGESTASDDFQVLSLIAIPKNTALTMLLSGSIGYAPATGAFGDGSSVVLSAGYDANLSNADLAQNLGNIEIGNTQFTSYVSGIATNAINIAPNGGSVEFGQGADLTGFRSISAIAGDGESILSNQGLFLRSNQGSTGGAVTIRAEGGATGGDINALSLFVTANGDSDSLFPEGGEGIAATGGTVTLQASGGRITADMISLEAIGRGFFGMDTGGTGTGGTISASVSAGGSITANNFDARASGFGGEGALVGGDGIGGNVSLLEQGGTLNLGFVTLSARGVGASYSGRTGDGQGGTARIDIISGTTSWDDLRIEADAESGELYDYDGVSGSATGRADAISVHVGTGATLDITGSASLTADAYAGVRGAGNFGRAGGVSVLADSGGTLHVGESLTVSANAATSRESQYAFPDSSPTLTGGTVNVLANGGTIDVHQLRATANAIGTGATGSGGIVTGGTAIVGAAGGGTISTFVFDGPGFLSVEAEAYGGNGPAPSNAFGGTATLFAQDGTLNLDGYVQVSAMATSGDGTEATLGTGFSAQGGTASIELRAGTAGTASLSTGEIAILADGDARGGTRFSPMLSGNGGSGTGGTARLSVAAGTLDADVVTIRADGLGGVSAPLDVSVPLQSGDGFGGTASLVITGGTTTITDNLDLAARGFGGHRDLLDGGGGNDIVIGTGSLAGNGTGGNAEAFLSGGTISTASLTLDGGGIGGTGTDDFYGMTTITNGGSGTGGSARIVMPAGSSASLAADDVLVQANGLGGRGGTDGTTTANGGNGTAGSAGFTLADGSFALGATSVQADGIGGDGATGGNGVGGVASFLLNDSVAGMAPRNIASLSLTGNGIGGISDTGPAATETAGQVQLAANVGSAASGVSVTGDFTAAAQGSVAPAGNGFVGSIGGGAFNVGGNSTIATTRDIFLTIGSGGAFATTGMLAISTPRTVTSSGLVSSGSGASISANLGISMTDLNSGGIAFLSAPSGAVTISNDLRSTGVSVQATSLNISSLGSLSFYNGMITTGDLSIQTAGDLLLPYVDAQGNVTLTSTGGALVTEGPIRGVDISLSSAADLTSFTVEGTGSLSLTSTAGSVAATTALDATAITISAARNIDLLDMTSAGAVSLNSGGTINVGGTIIGTDITATSADIAISSAGSIGARGTTRSITLRNANAGDRTFIGGTAQTNGYQVDATELRQLFADNSITLGAADGPLGSGADLVIGNLALAYGANGNIGTGGTLKILAPGRVEVSGAVALTTSSDADRFSIDPSRIDIITDTGSIVMRDSAGNLQGELELVGGTIVVASSATLSQIANLTTQAAINEALAAAPATANPDGYLQASSIVVNATDAFYIANTGAPSDGTTSDNADRRGFTANRLSIVTGSAATHISINGVIVDSAGLAVTGFDVVPLVSINGQPASLPSRSSRFSTINGCFIGGSCEFSQQNELTRTKSDIEVPLDPEGGTKPEYLYVLEIEQPQPDDLQPLVDEPVTGVGNDDLWGSNCGPDSGGCPQGGNSQ
jgi:filamentous hemagglutinin family protein